MVNRLLKSKIDSIELHASDSKTYLLAILVSRFIVSHNLVSITKLQTHQNKTQKSNDDIKENLIASDSNSKINKKPILIIGLKKSSNFD